METRLSQDQGDGIGRTAQTASSEQGELINIYRQSYTILPDNPYLKDFFAAEVASPDSSDELPPAA